MAAEDCPDLPVDVVTRLRSICLALPDVAEEQAWVGQRWVVRRKTFAHAFFADEGTTPALVKVARAIGPGPVVVFRAEGPELDALRHQGPPFYAAGWGRDVMSMKLEADVDWDEVRELLTESYCVMAPEKLRLLVDRPQP